MQWARVQGRAGLSAAMDVRGLHAPARFAPIAFALFAFALGVALALAPTGPADFKLFWYVGRHTGEAYADLAHTAGFARLGTPQGPHDYLPFLYPPPFLLVLAPLGQIPLALAKPLWSGGCCAAFAWVAARDTRWATPLLALSLPLLWCAALGQTGLMIAALTIAAFQRLDERPRLAGVLLAVAACVKPQALLLAPVVLWGRWEVVRAAVVAAAVIVLASLLFGPSLWLEWAHNVTTFRALVEPTYPKVGPPYLVPSLWWRILLGGAGVAFAWRERNLWGLLVGGLLCSPYVQLYDLAGLSFIGATLVRDARRARAGTVVFGAVLTACPAWPAFTTAYCAGLMGIAEWRRRRRREK